MCIQHSNIWCKLFSYCYIVWLTAQIVSLLEIKKKKWETNHFSTAAHSSPPSSSPANSQLHSLKLITSRTTHNSRAASKQKNKTCVEWSHTQAYISSIGATNHNDDSLNVCSKSEHCRTERQQSQENGMRREERRRTRGVELGWVFLVSSFLCVYFMLVVATYTQLVSGNWSETESVLFGSLMCVFTCVNYMWKYSHINNSFLCLSSLREYMQSSSNPTKYRDKLTSA